MSNHSNKARSGLILPTFAVASVILGPLAGFLSYHQYPLLTAPVGLILIVLLLIGFSAGIFESLAMPVMASFILSAAVTFSVDYLLIGSLIDNSIGRLVVLSLLFLVVVLINTRMRPNSYTIVLVAFLAMTLVPLLNSDNSGSKSAFINQAPIPVPDDSVNIVLHLILDEHIGLAGVPEDIEGGLNIRRLISEFYMKYGFKVNSHAYSRYFHTGNSIPNLLNYSSSMDKSGYSRPDDRESGHIVISENAYFDSMAGQGFDIHVYQPNFIEYCDQIFKMISACTTYPSNSILSVADLPVSPWEKSVFIVRSFLQQSSLFKLTQRLYQSKLRRPLFQSSNIRLPAWEDSGHRTGPVPAHKILDRIIADVQSAKADRLIFAHLLSPHYPYVYEKDCSLKRPITSWQDRGSAEPMTGNNNKLTREIRYVGYFEQLTCLYSELASMLDTFEAQGILEKMTIILHGDHGSRISLSDPRDNSLGLLAESDYIDAFSTLYAVRGEGIEAGIDMSIVPLEWLLKGQAGLSRNVEISHYFYLRSDSEDLYRIEGNPFATIKSDGSAAESLQGQVPQ